MFLNFLTFSLNILLFTYGELDYFSDDFDDEKNCKFEDEMDQLRQDPLRCAKTSQGSDAMQWQECKKILYHQLLSMCPLNLEKVSIKDMPYKTHRLIHTQLIQNT